jgi:hypothetical protein
MVDNRRQVCFRYLWKHFANSAADVIFRPLLSRWATMKRLPSRIAFDLLYHPVISITRLGFAKTRTFIVLVAKLAASKLDDIEREMVSDTVDMVR